MSFLRMNPSVAGGSTAGAKGVRPERHRRPIGEAVLHVPQTLRALVRADEIWLVVLAALIGIAAGLLVVAMTGTTQLLHEALFLIDPHDRLSSEVGVDPMRAILVPSLGGLAMGLSGLALARWRPSRAVDPIEANALYGGRMSLNDSLVVVFQTILSNSVGASVGLEAGYTQIGSAIGSRVGRGFRVRRNDLRLLVGCGAAGAIAAAFDAPLTGAFYAFELVIGTYSLATLAPVVAAALSAVIVTRLLNGGAETFDLQVPGAIEAIDYVPVLALAILCALGGIAIMRGVTLTEQLFRRSRVPMWVRPAIGGLALGGMALISPQVLSSGHGALHAGFDAPYTLTHISVLIVLKSLASAISIGCGFRGGLFFASLFLGALMGKLFAGALAAVTVTGGPARRGLRHGRHEFARRRRRRRPADDVLPGAGDDRQPADDGGRARRLGSFGTDGATHLRLLLRHMALPPARRGYSQRGGRRLDAQPDRRADDAPRSPHRAGRRAVDLVPPRLSAGRHAARHRGGRGRPLRRHRAGRRSPRRRRHGHPRQRGAAPSENRLAAADDGEGGDVAVRDRRVRCARGGGWRGGTAG